jgi:hypothetical protein
MALLSLNLVTKTFITLLKERLPRYADWPGGATLNASPAPPDAVSGNHALSFYLYHLREDAHTKAQDWGVDDAVPLRYKPMGLTLNYVLCPRSSASLVEERAYIDQLLMGLSLKTLRDYPVIDDTTTVETAGPPKLLMPPGLRDHGNRLRIQLLPTPPEEATHYWQSGSQPLRLAAYYEVSAALLEPEEPHSRRTRVLSVGVHTLLRGRPWIESTRNTVTFKLPGETLLRETLASPAEAAYGASFEVSGSDLKGDKTALLINHRDFSEPVEADATWNLRTDGSVLHATVRAKAGTQDLLPGIYGAIVRTTARSRLPDGSQRDFDAESNESAFSIAPAFAFLGFVAGLGSIKVTGFDPTLFKGNDLMLFAGVDRLLRATGAPAIGEFRPVGPDKLEFRLPAGTPAGTEVPLRLIVRYAESAPQWVQAP